MERGDPKGAGVTWGVEFGATHRTSFARQSFPARRHSPENAAGLICVLRTAKGETMNEAVKHINLGAEFWTPEKCYIIEMSNTPDDPEASIARARVKREETTRWHRVVGMVERYVILEGSGRVEVGNLPPQDVGVGDVVLIPPSCRQRITNTGESDLIFLAVCTPRFRPEAYEDIDTGPVPSGSDAEPGAAPDRGRA